MADYNTQMKTACKILAPCVLYARRIKSGTPAPSFAGFLLYINFAQDSAWRERAGDSFDPYRSWAIFMPVTVKSKEAVMPNKHDLICKLEQTIVQFDLLSTLVLDYIQHRYANSDRESRRTVEIDGYMNLLYGMSEVLWDLYAELNGFKYVYNEFGEITKEEVYNG